MNITSIANDKVKYWSKLHMKKFRDEEHKFIVEGDHLVNIALQKNLVDELICLKDEYDFENKYIVTERIMEKISSQVSASKVMAVCHYDYTDKIEGNVLLIDRIQDPGNLGTIIRSASAFNFKTLILSPNTVDVFKDKTIRASEGMIFNLNYQKKDLKIAIKELKQLGYRVYGTDVVGGNKISEKENVAIIIGNEGQGMDPDLKKLCDELIHIPMNKECESLNAGVAASILMYEVYHE